MSSLDTMLRIADTSLMDIDRLMWCLVDDDKVPHKANGENGKPNDRDSFSPFLVLAHSPRLTDFAGVGISVNFSSVCAVDIDHCFSRARDIDSADDRVKDIISLFKPFSYIEFSFSGHGCRILFECRKADVDHGKYYIKNPATKVEFYDPDSTYRYVTITGYPIAENFGNPFDEAAFKAFLDRWMKRPEKRSSAHKKAKSAAIDPEKKLRYLIFTDPWFQDLWFAQAPGSGKNESEMDFAIIKYIADNVSADAETVRKLFLSSPFCRSKDYKHESKLSRNDYAYFYETFRKATQ